MSCDNTLNRKRYRDFSETMAQGWSTMMEMAVGGAEQGAQERGGWRLTWMVTRTEENKSGGRDCWYVRKRGIEIFEKKA